MNVAKYERNGVITVNKNNKIIVIYQYKDNNTDYSI